MERDVLEILPEEKLLLAGMVFNYNELTINPWRVFYRKQAEQIVVLVVVDSRRDLENALWNRLMR